MTGARFPSSFGRAQAGPLQVSIPSRLPGGLWGPQPISGVVSWDANGAPLVSGFQSLDASSQSLLQTEWPIPTRWEIQLSLSLVCLQGGLTAWVGSNFALNVQGHIDSSVESAAIRTDVSLPFGPGPYPLIAAVNGIQGLGSTFPVIGQTVRLRIDGLTQTFDPSLSGSTWQWTVNAVAGLTSAGWPSP